jgi:hypothetical protein
VYPLSSLNYLQRKCRLWKDVNILFKKGILTRIKKYGLKKW